MSYLHLILLSFPTVTNTLSKLISFNYRHLPKIEHEQKKKTKKKDFTQSYTEDSSTPDSKIKIEENVSLMTVEDFQNDEEIFQNKKEYKNNTINIRAIEFDWIFTTKRGEEFLEKLSRTSDLSFYEIDIVKHIINFMWKRFLPRLFLFLFFPFLVFFATFLLFATWLIDEGYKEADDWAEWDTAVFVVGIFLAVFQLFFVGIEIYQFTQGPTENLKSFWNLFDCLSIIFNYALIIMALTDADVDSSDAIAVIAVFIMWIRLFYLLRVFAYTSYLVNMIISIVWNMKYFMLAFLLSTVAFGNCFYILGRNTGEINFTGDDVWQSFIYAYNFALGNLGGIETFANSTDEWLIWLVFIGMTIFTNIIMLNLLISIVTETFEKIQETQDTTKLQEFATIMRENEFLISRKSLFGNIKYIIVAEPSYAEGEENSNWEGRIQELKKAIKYSARKTEDDLQKFEKRLHRHIEIDMTKKMKPFDDKIVQAIDYFDSKLTKTFENTEKDADELKKLLDSVKN